jgi:hypothetical protein
MITGNNDVFLVTVMIKIHDHMFACHSKQALKPHTFEVEK